MSSGKLSLLMELMEVLFLTSSFRFEDLSVTRLVLLLLPGEFYNSIKEVMKHTFTRMDRMRALIACVTSVRMG